MGNNCCTSRPMLRFDYSIISEGETLKEAILARDTSEVGNILSSPSDPRILNCIMDDKKNSPLLYVCEHSPTFLNLIDLVASKGGFIDMRNILGESAIHILARKGNSKESTLASIKLLHKKHNLLLQHKDLKFYEPLWYSVQGGDLHAYKYLKSWGCNRNHIDNEGETVLFPAVRTGMLSLVKQMVEYDEINVHHTNKHGQGLLEVAAEHSAEIVEYLKLKGLKEKVSH